MASRKFLVRPAISCAVTAIIMIAVFTGSKWAGNLVAFWSIIPALAGLSILNKDENLRESAAKLVLPKWLAVTFGIVDVGLLAAAGWFWCAAAFLSGLACTANLYRVRDSK